MIACLSPPLQLITFTELLFPFLICKTKNNCAVAQIVRQGCFISNQCVTAIVITIKEIVFLNLFSETNEVTISTTEIVWSFISYKLYKSDNMYFSKRYKFPLQHGSNYYRR